MKEVKKVSVPLAADELMLLQDALRMFADFKRGVDEDSAEECRLSEALADYLDLFDTEE